MRHYFGYDIEGKLRSVETYGPAGWPTTHCMEDGSCEEPSVTSLRETRATESPEIINWIVYDCPCDPANGARLRDCLCVNTKFPESYVDVETQIMKTKPTQQIYIDGEVVAPGTIVTRDPGATVTVKLVSALMPDGERVRCYQGGPVDLTIEDEWELEFMNGETPEFSLTAPAQGTRGVCGFTGRLIRPANFALRGFTTPA